MTDRKKMQVIQDFIRFINVMNDLIDNAAWKCQEIDPRTGEHLINESEVPQRDFTLEELKEQTTRNLIDAHGYWIMINNFLTKIDDQYLLDACQGAGIDAIQTKSELNDMKAHGIQARSDILAATTKTELAAAGQYLHDNVPKLILVRRSWNL